MEFLPPFGALVTFPVETGRKWPKPRPLSFDSLPYVLLVLAMVYISHFWWFFDTLPE